MKYVRDKRIFRNYQHAFGTNNAMPNKLMTDSLWKMYLTIAVHVKSNAIVVLTTYLLLIRRYNCFAVLTCLRSVRNRSRSRAFVCQSVIPALMADASTPFRKLRLWKKRVLQVFTQNKNVGIRGLKSNLKLYTYN